MKISNSKKQLARIISENGGWRDGAEWAAQDKSYCSRKNNVVLYKSKPPKPQVGESCWGGLPGEMLVELEAGELVRNWHQTILSRAEYFHLYPEPDADGWIEWKGGECPVKRCTLVDVKYANGITNIGVSALTDKTHADHTFGTAGSLLATNWSSGLPMSGIIAYRLHKQQSKPEFCESVMRSIPDPDEQVWTNPPSIEQLAADYRNAKDYAERKQQEADDAKVDANEALRKLEIAGEAIGLIVTPITTKQEPELVITVQAGDEVECVESNIYRDKYNGMAGTALEVDDSSTPYLVDFGESAKIWCYKVKFIRRP